MHVGPYDDNGSVVFVDSPALVSPAIARCDSMQFGIYKRSLIVPAKAKAFSIKLASHRLRQILKANCDLIGRICGVTDGDKLSETLGAVDSG
jgi:hypothetical protein